MLRLCLVAALICQAAPAQDADKAAADLLKKMEEQVMKAKTLLVEFEAAPAQEGREEKLTGSLMIGENGAFLFKMKVNERAGRTDEFTMKSDGKTVSVVAPRMGGPVPVDTSKWKPETVQRCLKRTTSMSNILGMFLLFGARTDPEAAFDLFVPIDVKSEGKEKVGEVEASILTFDIDLKEGGPGGGRAKFKLWIDPAKLRILKREIDFGHEKVAEKTTKFEINPAFPADAFETQTAAMLLEGRTAQLAASVALHARYTGRLPKTLEDLNRRPADLPATTFWPECGFWIGGALPKDIAYSVDATHYVVGGVREAIPPSSPIGTLDDRLKKHLEARVRIQLLKAAGDGFKRSTGVPVKEAQDLLKKPESARLWPDGGWIGGEKLPVDPWGDAFIIRGGEQLSVTLAKPQGRLMRLSELTPEQRKSLDEAAYPVLSDKDAADVQAQVARLGSEKLSDREKATQAILAKGAGALRLVEKVLAGEKDPEVVSRLSMIRDQFRAVRPSWMSEFQGRRYALAGTRGDPAAIPVNERNASTSLKTLTTAQADFRSNDRDGNRTNDFYSRDVAGLYALKGATGANTEATAGKVGEGGVILKLIEPSLAKADTTEGRWTYPVMEITEPEPKAGYFFAALKQGELGGKVLNYHEGDGRNADMFGFVAYPAEYGVTGKMTFIVNEDNTIWQKDCGGEDIDLFPANPPGAGWLKMD